MTTLIIFTEEMIDIMKIVKLLEESGLLIKCETIKNKVEKNKKADFLVCYYVHYVLVYKEIY